MISVNLVTFTLRNNAAFITTRHLCRVTPCAYNKVVTCKTMVTCEHYNPGQKSLGQYYCNIHIFRSFLGSLLKQCSLFENFLQFCLSPPYTKLKLGKNSRYTRLTLFVG